MSTIDTKLQNLNIYEGTLQQIVDAGIGVNDIAFATDVYFEDKFRYSIMPVASSDYLGQIVQYIGSTNNDYMQGAFYKCVSSSEHVEYVTGSGLTITIANSETFNNRLDTIASGEHKPVYYVNLSQNPQGSGNDSVLIHYFDFNGNQLNTITTTLLYGLNSFMGLTYSGNFSGGAVVNVYRDYAPHWVLLESKYVQPTIEFSNITGDPHDNVALDAELDRIEAASAIQVTSLPTITEDTKDKIYQYVGVHDPDNGLFQGSFYKAIGLNYEVDTEESVEIDNMTMNVFNETLFVEKLQNIKSSYPDATYLDILLSGNHSSEGGYATGWYLDPEIRSGLYWPANELITRDYAGVAFEGTAVIDSDTHYPDTIESTMFHINILEDSDLNNWRWIPINVYPTQKQTEAVLLNKSGHNTSIIENKSNTSWENEGDNCTVIGVNTTSIGSGCTVFGYGNIASQPYSTIFGTNSEAKQGSVAVGNSALANGFNAVTIGTSAQTTKQYGVAIGFNTKVDGTLGLGVAVGAGAQTTDSRGIAIGPDASAGLLAIAIGSAATASANHAIQLGNGSNYTAETFQVRHYRLLDTSTGIIPYERLTSNSPTDGYCLVYDSDLDQVIWKSVTPEIPETQMNTMPAATDAGRVVQYIGETDGTYTCGYFYKETFNPTDRVYYWRRLNTQPTGGGISYDDLNDRPQINDVTLTGDLDPVDDLGFHAVSISGSYADLNTKPGINGVTLSANKSLSDLNLYDNVTIKENSENHNMEVHGVLSTNSTPSTIKFWTGTQSDYDNLLIKDATTLYVIITGSNE